MVIDKRDIPLVLASIKINRKAYNTTMNSLLLQLAKKQDRPTVALKTRIITTNELFERLENALTFINDGLEDYE